jgi:pimeloyl-ACP methyl ester carboxylesterase
MIRTARVPALLAAALAAGCAGSPAKKAAEERIRLVDGKAGRLRVSDGGSGEPAVVFLHGLGGDLEVWREQLDRLRPRLRAVAYDQRGHGGSERARDGVYTIEALAGDLASVVDALALQRFHLVGHSLSGAVLTAYAGAHPERVAGLVYADGVGDLHAVPAAAIEEAVRKESSPSFGQAELRDAFEGMLGPAARPATRERVLASLARLDPPAFAALRRSLFGFAVGARLSAYRGPILAIEAEGPPNPVRASAVIPAARRRGIIGVSHWLHMDDPATFGSMLDPFLGLPGR